MRLVRVNQVYFMYPSDLTLNDDDFLMALLVKAKQIAKEAVYTVCKDGSQYLFHPQIPGSV